MSDTDISRRGVLAGIGAAAVTLLFRRKLDRVLAELTAESEAELEAAPAAADIVCRPQMAFRPERLVIPAEIAPFFVLESISIGGLSQFSAHAGPVPAELFTAGALDNVMTLDAASPGTEISFRVRYVGDDPAGLPFHAALIGQTMDDAKRVRMAVLPIASGANIIA